MTLNDNNPLDRQPNFPPWEASGSGLSEYAELTIEDELAAIAERDPWLADGLAQFGAEHRAGPIPAGLSDRIYAASVAMLPMSEPQLAGDADDESKWAPFRVARRWAPRLGMAAAIGLALVLANPFAGVLDRQERPEWGGGGHLFMPALLADGGTAAEPMLVALLCDRGGTVCWLDLGPDDDGAEENFLQSAGDDVDSLLMTRGARFDDFVGEFSRIVRDAPNRAAVEDAR